MKVHDLPPHDPLTIIEDQEHRLVWIEPEEPDDLWDPRLGAFVPRPSGLWALLAGLLAGGIVGLALGFALASATATAASTSRPAHSTAGEPGAPAATGSVGASAREVASASGGLTEAPSAELGTALASGLVAYAAPSHGDRYLALPGGPGVRVRICSSATRCLDRVSTDAGPDLAMQRAGRIADVSYVDFAWLCRCSPPSVGLIVATIEWTGPGTTPPATDVSP